MVKNVYFGKKIKIMRLSIIIKISIYLSIPFWNSYIFDFTRIERLYIWNASHYIKLVVITLKLKLSKDVSIYVELKESFMKV